MVWMNVGENLAFEHGKIRASAFELIIHKDTFAARDWLWGVMRDARGTQELPGTDPAESVARQETLQENGDEPTGGPLQTLVVVVEYNPEESWSLTVMLALLMELEPAVQVDVVVVAEGRRWALPVLVADFPRLTMVLPGRGGYAALSEILQRGTRERGAPTPQ